MRYDSGMPHSQASTTDEPSSIYFTALHPNLTNDRWSPLAIIVYVVAAIMTLINLAIFAAVVAHFEVSALLALLAATTVNTGCLLGTRLMFRRVNQARADDLLAFAAANSLSINTHPLSDYLPSTVRIVLKSTPLFPPIDWHYTTDLFLQGDYKAYPISLYNVSLDLAPIAIDSDIEHGMLEAHYTAQEIQTSISLTVHEGRAGMLAARQCGVILWNLPDLSPEAMTRIHRATRWHDSDIQTDGKQLAILLPTTLPYDRAGMRKLYRLLDCIYSA